MLHWLPVSLFTAVMFFTNMCSQNFQEQVIFNTDKSSPIILFIQPKKVAVNDSRGFTLTCQAKAMWDSIISITFWLQDEKDSKKLIKYIAGVERDDKGVPVQWKTDSNIEFAQSSPIDKSFLAEDLRITIKEPVPDQFGKYRCQVTGQDFANNELTMISAEKEVLPT